MTQKTETAKAESEKCGVEGCKRPYRAKGYCDLHFKKWRNGELAHGPYKTCLESGCRKPRKASALCEDHEKSKLGKKGGGEAASAAAPVKVETSAAPNVEAAPAKEEEASKPKEETKEAPPVAQ